MSSQNTPDTNAKILAARGITGRPYSDPMPDFPSFGAMFLAQKEARGDQTFLIWRDGDERQEWSYAQFYARCAQVANWMRGTLGIVPDERIATLAYNHPDTVAVIFASWMIGACVVPINAGEGDDRVQFIQQNGDVKAVFVMPDFIERHKALREATGVEKCVQINGEAVEGYLQLADAENEAETLEDANLANLDTESLLIYTSGTTGMPKGVLLQHHQILIDGQDIAKWHGLVPADRMQLVLPIHHVNGLIVTLVTPVYFGGSVVLNRKFSASRYWETCAEEGATCGSTVPTILAFLCEQPLENRPPDHFKFVICGAGPLTVDLATRWEERFGIPLIHGYGLSETTAYSCYLPFDLSTEERRGWLQNWGYPSIGVAIPCNEMQIHDDQGREIAPGEKGEIVIRGQNVMKEYFKRPEANADTFKHEWFRSGDEGFYQLDEQGRKFFFISGRIKELIVRGAVNYSPLEIDEIINRVPGVKAGMAVGFENSFYGEEVGAYVVLEEGATLSAEEFLAHCAEKLSFEKRPKVVVFGEEFPVTTTGKYQRNKLKPLFAEFLGAKFGKSGK